MKSGFVTHLMDMSLSLNHINKRLEAKCGLSLVQWYLLQALIEMPAVSPQRLAKELGVTPGTLSQTLTRLEKRELLFMRDDPHDARRKMISITREGKRSLQAVSSEFERAFDGCDRMGREIGQIAGFLRDKVKARLAENETGKSALR